MTHQEWIAQCIELALENAADGQAPFAALVVQDDNLVATGVNDVKATQDVAGHAEIRALQAAARCMGTRRLAGCVLYTSCEPCPMCLGAIYWSGITHVYYGLSVTEQAAFDDLPALQYAELCRAAHKRRVQLVQATPDNVDPRRPFQAH
ncbi:nucleoside deaminase [Vreelandella massiliensis]|uniref:nucleoside deaminase n=1 Tax=Vreelandella massiliensis TaxID=1816686 RepID=UPI00096A4954|nr:nucleoside deaminase [Halomonas massiliensis]